MGRLPSNNNVENQNGKIDMNVVTEKVNDNAIYTVEAPGEHVNKAVDGNGGKPDNDPVHPAGHNIDDDGDITIEELDEILKDFGGTEPAPLPELSGNLFEEGH